MAVQSGRTQFGMPLPDVTLPDLDGTPITLDSYRGGRPLVVAFACNHCPHIAHGDNSPSPECDRPPMSHPWKPGRARVAYSERLSSTGIEFGLPVVMADSARRIRVCANVNSA